MNRTKWQTTDKMFRGRNVLEHKKSLFLICDIAMNVIIWGFFIKWCQFTENLYHLCNPRSRLQLDESTLVETVSCACDMLRTKYIIIFSIYTHLPQTQSYILVSLAWRSVCSARHRLICNLWNLWNVMKQKNWRLNDVLNLFPNDQ